MARIPKVQNGNMLKRSRKYYREGYSPKSTLMRADYSVDTAGYSAGKKKFPATVTRTEEKNPSKTTTTQETIRRPRVKQMIKKAQEGKKVRLREDSRDYITKIKTDEKGDISSLKSRRTLKGFLTGAPRAKKIMKNGGKTPAWQRAEGKDPKGGLNKKGVASYRRANPGSKLQTAVTTKPSKLKPGSKDAKRRKSFCARMSGMKRSRTSAKTANDPNSRINKSLRKWNC